MLKNDHEQNFGFRLNPLPPVALAKDPATSVC